MSKLYKITDASILLDLVDPKTKKPLNYIIRYWEKEFKQIKPKKINSQRYFSKDQIELLKMIKFLLKDQRMTISGVKSLLNNTNKLDDYNKLSLKNVNLKNYFLKRGKLILKKLNKLRKHGKKITS